MTTYQKHASTPTADGTFDYNTALTRLKETFANNIRALGSKNTKGSARYQFEVDFMYALNELEQGPTYLRGKLYERPNAVINKLMAYIKAQAPAA